ncbi:unnamed protein product [Adineta ricciae]|uniref:DNRLRE domain-containing protein n=1 Tax=Adineta ricciae TaxID=249248 RepID=A0A815G6K1_ADIRI|nr:unnamed protein product [Adineta ricciae]
MIFASTSAIIFYKYTLHHHTLKRTLLPVYSQEANMPIYSTLLALLLSISHCCSLDSKMSTRLQRNRNTIIRKYDSEVNTFCAVDGSSTAHLDWQYLRIDAHSNYAQGCGQQFTRSLLTLDEVDSLPSNAVIKSAQIKLFGYRPEEFEAYSFTDGSTVTNEVFIKRILTEWDANTVTWMTQPSTTDTNAAVIPSTEATFPGTSANTKLYNFTIDITSLVHDIQSSGPGNNHGVMFQMKTEEKYRAMVFCSFNHPDIQRHPQIVMDIESSTTSTSVRNVLFLRNSFILFFFIVSLIYIKPFV